MKILLDTHILLWALLDDPKLSKHAREIILDPNNELFYSTVSVWEISLKRATSIRSQYPSAQDFIDACRRSGYQGIEITDTDITALDASRFIELGIHKDPFDHLLMAQAQQRGMQLITHDSTILRYELPFLLCV